MSKRLQVILPDEEMAAYEQTAQALGLTVSEWVRQSLRAAERRVSHGDPDDKIRAIRTATRHRFPAPDIETMLAEIERGYSESEQA